MIGAGVSVLRAYLENFRTEGGVFRDSLRSTVADEPRRRTAFFTLIIRSNSVHKSLNSPTFVHQ